MLFIFIGFPAHRLYSRHAYLSSDYADALSGATPREPAAFLSWRWASGCFFGATPPAMTIERRPEAGARADRAYASGRCRLSPVVKPRERCARGRETMSHLLPRSARRADVFAGISAPTSKDRRHLPLYLPAASRSRQLQPQAVTPPLFRGFRPVIGVSIADCCWLRRLLAD